MLCDVFPLALSTRRVSVTLSMVEPGGMTLRSNASTLFESVVKSSALNRGVRSQPDASLIQFGLPPDLGIIVWKPYTTSFPAGRMMS